MKKLTPVVDRCFACLCAPPAALAQPAAPRLPARSVRIRRPRSSTSQETEEDRKRRRVRRLPLSRRPTPPASKRARPAAGPSGSLNDKEPASSRALFIGAQGSRRRTPRLHRERRDTPAHPGLRRPRRYPRFAFCAETQHVEERIRALRESDRNLVMLVAVFAFVEMAVVLGTFLLVDGDRCFEFLDGAGQFVVSDDAALDQAACRRCRPDTPPDFPASSRPGWRGI